MNRRTFVRVFGGGVVLSATAGLAGCSREMPPEAIAAWQGPGPEADVRKWILSYAILAPHKEIHDLLDAPRPRYTVQMWARAGYEPQVEPAPRRGLEAQTVKP